MRMQAPVLALLFATTIGLVACDPSIVELNSVDDSQGEVAPDQDDDGGVVDDRVWPGSDWRSVPPEELDVDPGSIDAALDYAFTRSFNTQGVVIVKDGQIVGERYADDANADTPATSWSMAKSMLSVAVGIAIDDGDLQGVDDPVSTYLPAWEDPARVDLTLRDLLEMRSGLGDQPLLYLSGDQLRTALDRQPSRFPGEAFEYSNADSMTVGGALEAATGVALQDYAQERLFEPIGMEAVWWRDAQGQGLGYCCVDSTTRDFARFGLLAARGGVWDGEPIVSESWLEQSTRSVPGQDFYGLHWWVDPQTGIFSANGLHGQTILVDVENDLVMVRNGLYTRLGNDTVRTGLNAHQTAAPGDWDPQVFARLVRAGL